MTTALRNCLNVYAPGTTFSDILWDCTHPADDTVAWHIALESADLTVLTAFTSSAATMGTCRANGSTRANCCAGWGIDPHGAG